MERIAISKKLRFEIFKRDLFTCQYCGNNPPKVILEIDHIIPVSKNGTTEIDNLITSCFDCNRGKGDRELISLPQSTEEKTGILQEKEEQYLEYKKAQLKIQKRIIREVNKIDKIYTSYHPEYCLNDRFKHGSLRNFITQLGVVKVEKAMRDACGRIYDSSKAIKYFCGICWNIINNQNG